MKRQAVQRSLQAVRPAGVCVASGNEADTWTVKSLPALRVKKFSPPPRCRTGEALLSVPRRQWQPEISLDKISDAVIPTATKLRAVWRPWLLQPHHPNLVAAEIAGLVGGPFPSGGSFRRRLEKKRDGRNGRPLRSKN